MLIIHLIKTAATRAKSFLHSRNAYAELSRLEPYLLEDIGVKLVKGKVIDTNAVHKVEDTRTARHALTLLITEDFRSKTVGTDQFEAVSMESGGEWKRLFSLMKNLKAV